MPARRQGLRWSLLLMVGMVLGAMAWGAWSVLQLADERTKARWVAQQSHTADAWARQLTLRVESQQRLLNAVAQGLHSSMLDKPEVMAALMQQDGSVLQLFDTVYVALPGEEPSAYSAQAEAVPLDALARDALRKTLEDGKPSLTHMQVADDPLQVYVFAAVPLRREATKVSGALGVVMRWSIATVLPPAEPEEAAVQYMLVGPRDLVLAHSDPSLRWRNVPDVLGAQDGGWSALSEASTLNADTAVWGSVVAARVGLPQPQWQVVVVRDIGRDRLLQTGLPVQLWLLWAGGAVVLLALAAAGLWGWMAPWPKVPEAEVAGLADPVPLEEDSDALATAYEAALATARASAEVVFEAAPAAIVLEHAQRIRMATPQVAVLLGWEVPHSEGLEMAPWFEDPQSLVEVRQALVELGSFEGRVTLRKKDGGSMPVEVVAWVPASLPEATVWRLRLPWRQRRAVQWTTDEHRWRDTLTGLPTRESLLWSLQSWVNDSLRPASPSVDTATRTPSYGCLLFIDVDHLGMLNEVTSREMGNKVLRHVGRLLTSYTQALGDVARLGGDEFAVLLPGISLAHAQGVAQTLCDAVWRWQPSWHGERHWVSVSIGVVAVDALRHPPQEALRAADLACYEAKRRGRAQAAVGTIASSVRVLN